MKKLLIISLLLTGCTSTRISQSLSSGAIGCPVNKIKILNEKASISGIHDWVAVCDNEYYACNYFYPSPAICNKIKK